ncbi:hypothetical protein BDV96DRAFT_654656 [Lophiotrema nucula]|uniref:Uncharacterized protein n=1 Tax=Lophiotrema nucula TaxID=690887 RepID=A0A6A5YHK6_9PLEO|nr:hypothetical protein BDV96DRAFT_654656 [Lophiotrema nucula]
MPMRNVSWAAVAGRAVGPITSPTTSSALPNKAKLIETAPPTAQAAETLLAPRVAFISGHIDITPPQFRDNYSAPLDAAIRRGDAFVLSNSRGVDTLALAYLRAHHVLPARITIYMHTPRPGRKLNATQIRINKMRPERDMGEKIRKEGYNMKVIEGYHNERDAAMTEDSDYDILWVRGEAETAALYGAKYRPGRVSGTQKNKDRRAVKARRTAPLSAA